MSGAWSMTEDGEFVLSEPYASELKSIKVAAMNAWVASVVAALAKQTPYTERELVDGFKSKCGRDDMQPTDIVDAFVVQALEGEL